MAVVGYGGIVTRPALDYKFSFSHQNSCRVPVGTVVLSDIFTHPNGDSWQLKLKKIYVDPGTDEAESDESESDEAESNGADFTRSRWDCKLQLITMSPKDKCKWARVLFERNYNCNHTPVALFCESGQKYNFDDNDINSNLDVMRLEVEVLKCLEIERMPKPKIELPKSEMATEVLNWIRTEEFGDTIMVASDGQKFRCHREILAARSEVFRLMFNSGLKESRENLVNIKDFDSQIVAAMLQYLYSDECDGVGPIADLVYAAAHKYQLDRLKILCVSSLAANLSDSSIEKTQQMAEFYNIKKLKAKCVDYTEWHNTVKSTAPVNTFVNDGYSREDVRMSFRFRFGFHNLDSCHFNSSVLSNNITHHSSTWQVEFEKTNKAEARCHLHLVSIDDNFPKIPTVGLVDEDDENSSDDNPSPLVCFRQSGDKFDFGTFAIGSMSNRLTVEVLVYTTWYDNRARTHVMPPKSEMATEVLKWFKTEEFGDVTIVANDGMKFNCHRDILARRCELFLSKSDCPAKKAMKDVIDIADFDGDVVSVLLQFLYTDHVDRYGDYWETADGVYVAADQYKLDRLKILYEFDLADSLSEESVMKIYRLATVYHRDKLLAICADYLDIHRAELPMSEIVAEAVKIGGDRSDWN